MSDYKFVSMACECSEPNKIRNFNFSENLRPKKPLINPGPLDSNKETRTLVLYYLQTANNKDANQLALIYCLPLAFMHCLPAPKNEEPSTKNLVSCCLTPKAPNTMIAEFANCSLS